MLGLCKNINQIQIKLNPPWAPWAAYWTSLGQSKPPPLERFARGLLFTLANRKSNRRSKIRAKLGTFTFKYFRFMASFRVASGHRRIFGWIKVTTGNISSVSAN